MITLRPIDRSNVWDIAELDVREDQQDLVMTAQVSIMEAYAIEKSGGWAAPFGLYDGDTPVGFVMFTYGDAPDNWEPERGYEIYEINHFYIDERYQGRGYGKAGIRAALDYIRTKPAGPASLLWIGYKPWNPIAERLYFGAGFGPSDYRNYDERVGVMAL